MSIINDALKKAAKNKRFFQQKPVQILNSIDREKKSINQSKSVFKKRLFWIGAAAVSCLASILIINLFTGSPNYIPNQKHISPAQGIFQMRKMDIQIPAQTSNFRLSGILYEEQNPVAIINDRIVAIGALINGAELLEIHPDYVKLFYQGNELNIKIK